MKKILAIIIIVASVFAFAACDGETDNVDGVAKFVAMYKSSAPTKVVTTQVVSVGSVSFGGSSTLVTGVTKSGLTATVQTYKYDTIQTIENGGGDVVIPITGEPIEGSREYLEGKGERVDGKKWKADGHNFAPTPGSIAINLSEANITNVSYSVSGKSHSLMFTVPADKAVAVFGVDYGVKSDITVILSGNGAEVTGITVTYSMDIVSDDEDIVFPDADVTISTTYTYVLEQVDIEK